MCGIFGIIGTAFVPGFDAGLDALSTRGPDDRGTYHDGPAHLGHRRLAVIDLAGGHQPMSTPDGRFTLVFNGEIYNFPELARDLQAHGVPLRTHSDTEVLLHLLAREGRAALPRLDGMFAFACWDRQERRLLLARDRMGIKPLFYAQVQDTLIFASTLQPFFHLPDFPRHLDYHALREYLAVGAIPAPLSLLRAVAALRPAAWLEYEQVTGQVREGRFWDIPRPAARATPLPELIARVETALARTVRAQLVADVPLGAFLSGGIDSSLMVHYMAQASSRPVRTFSVRFPDIDGYDESPYAREVAAALGCEHHVLDARELDGPAWAQAVAQLDQPLGDAAYLPTLALAQLTRQHVTVAISGDGGDELFGGYERFLRPGTMFPDTFARRSLRGLIHAGFLPHALARRGLAGAQRLLWERLLLGDFPGTRKSMYQFLTPEARSACAIPETMQWWLELCRRFAPELDSDALMRGDLWSYLSENCLVKTDRASMAHALEVRVPLLGNEVVDAILPEPAAVKLSGGLKTVLKELARRHLPRNVWDRPKHGFSVPLKRSLAGTWRAVGQEWVETSAHIAPFLDAKQVRRQWERTLHGRAEPRLTFTLLVLLGWLRTHPVAV